MKPIRAMLLHSVRRVAAMRPYVVRRWRDRIRKWIFGAFGRSFAVPRQRRRETSAVAKYVGGSRRYPLDRDTLINLDFFRRPDGTRFESKADAYRHYAEEAERGILLQTHPLFDSKYYAKAVEFLDGRTPLDHFIEARPAVSPSPYFDVEFYLSEYPDLREGGVNPFAHFFCYGRGELRRPHELFLPQYVISTLGERFDEERFEDPLSAYIQLRKGDLTIRPHPLVVPEFIATQPGGRRGGDPLLAYVLGEARGLCPHPYFDPRYYQLAARKAGVEPPRSGETWLAHFLRTVPGEQVIDPSAAFSASHYMRNNPDIGSMNPLAHYEQYGRTENRSINVATPQAHDENITSVIEIEPTIFQAHQNHDLSILWGTIEPRMMRPGVRLIEGLRREIGGYRPTHVLLVSAFRRGGAERVNLKLIDAIVRADESARVLVLATDPADDEARHWLRESERVRVASFAHERELSKELAVVLLARFLEILRPQMVMNCNSAVGWDTYREFGGALSDVIRLRASLFCYDRDEFGGKVGYARDYIRDTISHLDLCYLDNAKFAEDLANDFSLSRADRTRLAVLYQHFGDEEGWRQRSEWPNLELAARVPRFLWPMRLHRQKRPDVFRQVAEALPDIRFEAWVPGGKWNARVAGGPKPKNVRLVPDEGQAFGDLDLNRYVGLLSTSAWEGLPTVLVEAAAAGLPIVASDVGGVSEIINDQTGYLVRPFDDVQAYITAIQDLLSDINEADARRGRAFEHARAQHGTEAFNAALERLGFVGGGRNRAEDAPPAGTRLGYSTQATAAATPPAARGAPGSAKPPTPHHPPSGDDTPPLVPTPDHGNGPSQGNASTERAGRESSHA